MRKRLNRFPLCFLTLLALLAQPAPAGEIYKWVDAQGKVHFGDKPRDPALADDIEAVTVSEAYKPPARSEQELEQMRRQTAEGWQRAREQQLEEQAEAERARAERHQAKASRCAEYAREIEALSEMQEFGGRPGRYYLAGEDGKSVSAEQQKAHVERLKAKSDAEGCSG
ncbi:DUF4124 domain-containing protein [Haliea sp. E17]|uniref:DUF4124 domain-containing protein n=1 Tax=Haliea sp. E17 TaxID=3401576 RepID=UPI003AAD5F9A